MLKKIKLLLNNIQNMTKDERDSINKLNKEKDAINKEVESLVKERFLFQKSKAIENFRIALKNELISLLKTNLNGETSISIKRGRYLLFGIVRLIQNNIIWNLPINIEKKDQYIELLNDNSFSPKDDKLFYELVEALSYLSYIQ